MSPRYTQYGVLRTPEPGDQEPLKNSMEPITEHSPNNSSLLKTFLKNWSQDRKFQGTSRKIVAF